MSAAVELTTLLLVSCCLSSATVLPSVDSDENYNPSDLLSSKTSNFMFPMNEPQLKEYMNGQILQNLQTSDDENPFVPNFIRDNSQMIREYIDNPLIAMVQDTAAEPGDPHEMFLEYLKELQFKEQDDTEHPPDLQTADSEHPIKESIQTLSVMDSAPPPDIKNPLPIDVKPNRCTDQLVDAISVPLNPLVSKVVKALLQNNHVGSSVPDETMPVSRMTIGKRRKHVKRKRTLERRRTIYSRRNADEEDAASEEDHEGEPKDVSAETEPDADDAVSEESPSTGADSQTKGFISRLISKLPLRRLLRFGKILHQRLYKSGGGRRGIFRSKRSRFGRGRRRRPYRRSGTAPSFRMYNNNGMPRVLSSSFRKRRRTTVRIQQSSQTPNHPAGISPKMIVLVNYRTPAPTRMYTGANEQPRQRFTELDDELFNEEFKRVMKKWFRNYRHMKPKKPRRELSKYKDDKSHFVEYIDISKPTVVQKKNSRSWAQRGKYFSSSKSLPNNNHRQTKSFFSTFHEKFDD